MEVHHHSSASHKKTKWTHYLWEFIMLFLAVTLGFLVENQREHYIEHIRAKEFSKTMVKDIQHDTANIHSQVRNAKIYIAQVDSLLALSKTKLEGRNASQFSFHTRFMYWTVAITWNRATFEQVKNSGSLRYFRNYELQEKLIRYQALTSIIDAEAHNHTVRGNELLNTINEIIDPLYHKELSRHYLFSLDTMSAQTKEALYSFNTQHSLENKREAINRLLNMVIVQQRNFQLDIIDSWRRAEELGTELISDLKKEYHLK